MTWKNGSYWIKGPLLFLVIYLIILILGIGQCAPTGIYLFSKWLYPAYWFIAGNISYCTSNSLDLIISGFIWAIIGTILGLLYKIAKKPAENH
jgi:hypothetical protein